ncbi:MAG TPA: hypothetical protein PKD93_09515, partial [Ferruginibacter sp.]|nr:hypothetical protein [Ferruginibacter sp.]
KTRLIRYLHEKKGFNVLAFEADFFGLNQGWDEANKDRLQFFLQGNIFPLWTLCDACRFLFKQYIPQTQTSGSPIQVSGFDNQMVLQFANSFLTKNSTVYCVRTTFLSPAIRNTHRSSFRWLIPVKKQP